ncbi:NAD dependent epimerase/dehydratase [Magnaporthiopsis poae ATCC 64411]|uniref:NAD dependent epimerase/dehydratase n=1 Tax=Magnaporthiopsis poae (strain ATCC 64411 / 73-15) TaxID=644358 RepID=A0A0C4E5B7_MAGP6|nr:NAD dependent epimerase/dehydratase [Magnaporthiopsis poae ATCC 64411]
MAARSVPILGGSLIIRDPEQQQATRADAPASGTLDILVRSLEEIKSEADASVIVQELNPDYVVAGGKGAPERTFAIDRDAAIHFIKASAATPSVKRFIMISHLASRRSKPGWWSSDD